MIDISHRIKVIALLNNGVLLICEQVKDIMGRIIHSNPIIDFFNDFIRSIFSITYRDIFGFGMMIIGVVAIWKPAGSILTANELFGLSPFVHGLWYTISGWLLSKHGNLNGLFRFIYTIPLLFYIFLTFVWIEQNWEIANVVVVVQYIMLYLAVIKLIAVRD